MQPRIATQNSAMVSVKPVMIGPHVIMYKQKIMFWS
jgi:hypothetical protein